MHRTISRSGVAVTLIATLVVATAIRFSVAQPQAVASDAGVIEVETPAAEIAGPAYTEDGALHRPKDWRKWVFVGASLGLSYSDKARADEEQRFHNVYIDPRAYSEYERTGTFPERSMLAMAVYRAGEKAGSPPKLQGRFEDELLALEVAVKDGEQFDDGWAYFDFSGGETLRDTARAFPRAICFDCHAEHAEDDNVFTQFYPVLRELQRTDP